MKKIIALFLTMIALFTTCSAFAFTTCGEALWALSDSQHVTGILDPQTVEERLPAQNPAKPYIVGFLDNGLVREKGLQEYCISASGTYGGFTYVCTKLEIFPQFEEIVDEVVMDTIGYEPNDVLDYILATMYFECKYAGHMFFKTNVSKFHVGNVTVNEGKNTFPLYMGDWDNDGKYELGFAAGWTQCTPKPCVPKPCIPKPVPKPTPKPCHPRYNPPEPPKIKAPCVKTTTTTTKTTTTCCPKPIQINIFSIVNNCFKCK